MSKPTSHGRTFETLPLLTAEEEQALAIRSHGDDAEDAREARATLVKHNAGLVAILAKAMSRRDPRISWDDAVSDGTIGLIRAAEKYEPGRERFTTYASVWIRSLIQNGLLESSLIRVPAYMHSALHMDAAGKAIKPFAKSYLPFARLALSARPVGMKDVRCASGSTDGLGLLRELAASEPGLSLEDREALQHALESLTDTERYVIIRRFGLDGRSETTLEEIGREFGFTREWVRQLESQILDRLRFALGQGRASNPPRPAPGDLPGDGPRRLGDAQNAGSARRDPDQGSQDRGREGSTASDTPGRKPRYQDTEDTGDLD